jgi:murein DD-endopeptidase MepM/ murein hydrolase activator NlpD
VSSRHKKSLLPKRASKREALTYSSSKIKPRYPKSKAFGFRLKTSFPKITLAIFVGAFLLTLQPTLSFPPIKQNVSLASQTGINQSVQIQSSSLPFIQLPHPGYLSTGYSRFHPGVDIAMGFGTPIKPIAAGIVEEVNFGFFGYGNQVIIKHSDDLTSMYAHMGRVYVTKGQTTTLDTIIGTIGLTGFTSGPHTHLEVTLSGRIIDPLTILPSLPDQPTEEFLKPLAQSNY